MSILASKIERGKIISIKRNIKQKGWKIELENKQKICDLLCVTLQNTRNLSDLVSLDYQEKPEVVVATFANGCTKTVNVAMDSGTALIKDIMKNIV